MRRELISGARPSAKKKRETGLSLKTSPGFFVKAKSGRESAAIESEMNYSFDVERNDPSELVAALRSQVDANAERLRRTREMVEVISQHLEGAARSTRARRKKK
jgi:hypothetical protein